MKNPGCEQGFSILEAIIVIAILAITLIPLMAMFPVQLTNSRHLENWTQDVSLAKKKVDEIKSKLYNDFDTPILPLYPLSGDFSSDGFPDFRFEIEFISRTTDDTICNLRVRVWNSTEPGDEFEVKTRIARR